MLLSIAVELALQQEFASTPHQNRTKGIPRLPPLRALQIFDATARHLCFSEAGDELSVTQGAVSKQIKLLESFYGEPLFYRKGTEVELTGKGRWLASKLLPIFDLLYGLNHFQAQAYARVRVAASPSFSLRYLTHQVERFNCLYPDIDIEIVLSTHHELCDDVADIFITTQADSPACYSELLFSESLVPVASSTILKDRQQVTVSELTGYTLLVNSEHRGSDWEKWFTHNQFKPATYQMMRKFSDTLLSTDAAERGGGIALVCEASLSQEQESGRLRRIGLPSVPSGRDYYVSCKSRRRHEPNIKLFCDWLCHQFTV